jgi:hypothetical protein
MSQKFEDIKISGSFIREITLVPSKKVRMILLRAPQHESEKQVSVVSDLEFHQVRGFRANFQAQPWLEITSCDSPTQSDYLKEYFARERDKPTGEDSGSTGRPHHFRIKCEEGDLEIIAETFTISVIDEIPHVGSSEPGA